jgi:hypothetical protein
LAKKKLFWPCNGSGESGAGGGDLYCFKGIHRIGILCRDVSICQWCLPIKRNKSQILAFHSRDIPIDKWRKKTGVNPRVCEIRLTALYGNF